MVYVIAAGGKQYVVYVGKIIKIEKTSHKPGDIMEFDDLLGSGQKVNAKVLSVAKGKKTSILKFKAKTRYMKRLGHRQIHSTIEIIDPKASTDAKKATAISNPLATVKVKLATKKKPNAKSAKSK